MTRESRKSGWSESGSLGALRNLQDSRTLQMSRTLQNSRALWNSRLNQGRHTDDKHNEDRYRGERNSKDFSVVNIIGAMLVAFIFSYFLTGSMTIAFFFALLSATLPTLFIRHKREVEIAQLEMLWPELLDHIISGIQSGMSVAQTISDLSIRGPVKTKSFYLECSKLLNNGSDVREIFSLMKAHFESSTCDQVCEVLEFSLSAGSREISTTLRTLSGYIRTNLGLREEIKAKQDWIRNSAILAAVAPWLLLLLLSTKSSTVQAYSTSSGVAVLSIGAGSTIGGYFWMKRVGRVPATPRVFS